MVIILITNYSEPDTMSDTANTPDRTPSAHKASASPSPEPRLPSQSLFGNGNRVWIEHSGRSYALFITRQGKLILTR